MVVQLGDSGPLAVLEHKPACQVDHFQPLVIVIPYGHNYVLNRSQEHGPNVTVQYPNKIQKILDSISHYKYKKKNK